MGSGKSTVGRALAERLGRPFSDSDPEIVAETGRTVRELADEIGVEEMHELESRHLLAALERPEPAVIAAAASTIEDPEARDALRGRGVQVIWLRAAGAELTRRFLLRPHRPLFGKRPRELLAEQAAERDPLFAVLDPIAIDTEGKGVDAVVDEALAALQ